MTDLRRRERQHLVRTLRNVGPDAPTLCSAWVAGDVAAHLSISERGFGAPMLFADLLRRILPATATRRAIDRLQPMNERLIARTRAAGWDPVLSRLESGPPRLYRRGPLAAIRLVEEWVHHEDVRRGTGQPARKGDDDMDDALWQAGLRLLSYPELLPGRTDLLLVLPDGRSKLVGAAPRVRIEGRPGEILLYLAGRTTAAEVTVDGTEDDIRTLGGHLAV